MENIVVFGASGHAKVILDIIEKQGIYTISGLIDTTLPVGSSFCGYTILGSDDNLSEIAKKYKITGGIIAVGENALRSRIAQNIRILSNDFLFINAIHPSTQIARDVKLGSGNVIMAGAIINAAASLGHHCIINTRASLDHDGTMHDFSTLAPGVITGGNVSVGTHAFIGMGSVILPNITIGEYSIVGAASLVTQDIAPYILAYGSPATPIRTLNNHS